MEFDINALPEEMRTAMQRLHAAIRRERKAERQFSLWREEHANAAKERIAIEKTYGEVSLRWNPDTQTMEPLETLE